MEKEGSRAVLHCLVVDNEDEFAEVLHRAASDKLDLLRVKSGQEALEKLINLNNLDFLFCKGSLPDMCGSPILAEARRLGIPRIIISNQEGHDLVRTANAARASYIVEKPYKVEEITPLVYQLIEDRESRIKEKEEKEKITKELDFLRGQNDALTRNLDERSRDLLIATRDLERKSNEIENLACRDNLTGLYNYNAVLLRLNEELARATRHGHSLSLLYLDVDRFSHINKRLGFQLGDEVLRTMAEVFRNAGTNACLRESDIISRYSGEEFLIILPETKKGGALVKANRLRQAIAGHSFPGGERITVSVGLAAYPEDGDNAEDLLTRAEDANRAAKHGGRNNVHVYSSQGIEDSLDDVSLSSFRKNDAISDISRNRSYYEELPQIVSRLRRDRAITCLYIDLRRSQPSSLAPLIHFGDGADADLYDQLGILLDDLVMEGILVVDDLLCRTEEGDAYLCFLSQERRHKEKRPPLEELVNILETNVNKALRNEVSPAARDSSVVAIGFSRILNNTMTRPERLVTRVVNESRESARLQAERLSQRNKALLQEVILGELLTPVYQPIVDLGTGQISGFEALVRGPKNTFLQSPANLFRIADEVGLTFELDRACFRACLRGAAGLEPIHRLFVNLLPWSFYDSSFIETEVSHLLNAAGLTPANVVFEITEKLAIENFTSFRSVLSRFTAMGFGVAVDDVGTKHSNLESVMALRPNLIKISDIVTTGISRSEVKREMMASLGRIAAAVDAVVVAEGIETPDDLVVLHDLGIRYGQGFFLARPGPPFPSLRKQVAGAIKTLSKRKPHERRAHSTDSPLEMDEHGEFRDPTRPGSSIREAVRRMGRLTDSGIYENIPVDLELSFENTLETSNFGEFDERTRDHLPRATKPFVNSRDHASLQGEIITDENDEETPVVSPDEKSKDSNDSDYSGSLTSSRNPPTPKDL